MAKSTFLLRCLVLDDEYPAVKLLSSYVEQTDGLEMILGTTKVQEATPVIEDGNIDLIFLDIEMPELNGLQLLSSLPGYDFGVILTTAYQQYALAGYEFDVIDYLLKPITFQRFLVAINKARKRMSVANEDNIDHIFVKTEYKTKKLKFDDILYIEGLRDYIAFHLTGSKVLLLDSMRNMEAILPQNRFIRIHKSYIINREHIDFIEKGRIVVHNTWLPIGETYKAKVSSKLGI
jgi:two-component system, LytTR family, response regulator